MKEYEIKMVGTDFSWDDIPYLEIENKYFDTPADLKARAQICYDEDAILVHLISKEKNIRAFETALLGTPCHDSCLEFFFCPMEGDKRYFNIEYNSNGCIFLGMGTYIGDLVRFAVKGDIFSPKIIVKEDGWEIFYSVPFEFICRFFPGFEVYEGKKMLANCYKCSEASEPKQFMSWSPIVGEPFKFHRPECFGTMTFR